ncbi:SRPBCC family protein [Fictibacillus barbaricus]|uniref:SRPBCC family protein n=1 Tax=Fictibacillus barbaricus TaxID=182136 RepID=A0ABS2Z9T3_9BACL|nr:SRPBCC family protein [Fictibacillus barbaricus]MBN3544912.1 SRPBCC family protein [Fictibacillus barbaricus]GGB63132.1 ATPase [Fictibacillus barbaricus]
MTDLKFVYVSYIESTPERVWDALTNGDVTEQYFFGSRVESDWKEGSRITYSRSGEVTDWGEILKCEPQKELSFTWTNKWDYEEREEPTIATFTLKELNGTVKLTLRHENLMEKDYVEEEDTFVGYNNGWPAILSNLKTLLETGRTLPPVIV